MSFSMIPHRSLFLLGIAVLSFLISACRGGSQGGADKVKVGFVSNNPATFWTIAEAGCRKAEGETGVEVIFRRPQSGDPALQKEIIDILLSQDIKALAISVIDPKGQRPYLDEIAARVPLVTQDNDAPDSKRLCYIGTNNYLAGRAVGQLVKEAMPDGGVIAIFVGQLEPLNARQRRQGALDELAGTAAPANINEITSTEDGQMYGKYRLFRTYTDQPIGEQRAQQNATDALTQLEGEKNLCFIGLWAYNPPAILTAVKDRGKVGQVKIVGFDEDVATLTGIADGHIHGTVVQDPFGFGYEATKLLALLAKGDKSTLPKDGIRYVPHRVITKDGGEGRIPVAKFRADLEAMLGKKSGG
jgi:ribose transport system substrate-binding protein